MWESRVRTAKVAAIIKDQDLKWAITPSQLAKMVQAGQLMPSYCLWQSSIIQDLPAFITITIPQVAPNLTPEVK